MSKGTTLSCPKPLYKNLSNSDSSIDQGFANGPFPFSLEGARLIQKEVTLAFSKDKPLLYDVSKNVKEVFGNAVKRLICSLKAYYDSPNPVIPFKVLLDGILDKDFALTLKKFKTSSITRTFDMTSYAEDGLDEYFHYRIETVGDIFNYRYWFPWEEEDPKDYLYHMIDMPDIDQRLIDDFEAVLYEMLPSTLPVVQPDEVLLASSSSTCISDHSGNKTKVFKDKQDPLKNTFSKGPMRGHRTLIYKCPTELRECIILPIDQSNTIKLIEKQLAVLCRYLPHSGYGFPSQDWEEIATKLRSQCEWYVNRDLTKEGLTKPRWIMKSIGKVLQEKYPDIPAFGYFGIYSGLTLVLEDGTELHTKRGHGLGMGNALTTVMQCVVFEQIKQLAQFDIIGNPLGLFYNDDGTIGALREETIDSYVDAEDELLELWGLIRKDSKTYKGRVSIFLEDYWPVPINKKVSYELNLKYMVFSAVNVVHAKTMYHNLYDYSIAEFDKELFTDVLNFFGSEFSYEEANLPWWAGGWVRAKLGGVDCTFHCLPELNQALFRGLNVGSPRDKPNYIQAKGTYHSPIEYIYKIRNLDPRVDPYLSINQPMGLIAAKYHRMENDNEAYHFYQNEYIRRIKIWREPAKPYSLFDLYDKIINTHSTIDFLPPRIAVLEKPLSKVTSEARVEFPNPIEQPNPLLGCISYFSGIDMYIKYVIPFPWFPGVNMQYIDVSRQEYDDFLLSFNSRSEYPLASGFYKKLPNVSFNTVDYLNPHNVCEVWQTLTGLDTYPVRLLTTPLTELFIGREEGISTFRYWSHPFFLEILDVRGTDGSNLNMEGTSYR